MQQHPLRSASAPQTRSRDSRRASARVSSLLSFLTDVPSSSAASPLADSLSNLRKFDGLPRQPHSPAGTLSLSV